MPRIQNLRHLPLANVIGESPSRFHNTLLRQRGASSIEYALLSTLIAMVILASVCSTGIAVSDLWTNIEERIAAAIG